MNTRPRIAIPMPHGTDLEYAERSISQYERAVELAGGEPVRVQLDSSPEEVKQVMKDCDGVLLPGSKADVDPAKFNAPRSSHTAEADPQRDAVDELLLADAYSLSKPVLGICYGLQTLNVFRKGSLVQHIPDFLPEAARAKVDHEAGKSVPIAHAVEVEARSRLGQIVSEQAPPTSTATREAKSIVLPVNSSHHQSADAIGSGLRVVARCVEDGIIEAVESTSPDHFVVAVQWHPERSVDDDAASREIFRAFVDAADKHR